MRFFPSFFAGLCAILFANQVRATSDLPTVKIPIGDRSFGVNASIPAIDLRNHFEVTGISGQVVQFKTTSGPINIEMLAQSAPKTVTNFLAYVTSKRYTTSLFHRTDLSVEITQGGGFAVQGNSLNAIVTDPPVVNEYVRPNIRGTIAMAKQAGNPNSATSEWFFNLADNTSTLGPLNNGGFTVFGRVTGTGMSVVDAIAAIPTYNASALFGGAFGQLPLMNYLGGPVQIPNIVFVNSADVIPIFPAQAGATAVITFSVNSSNPALVNATVSGSMLSLTLANNMTGFADVTVDATDSNGNFVEAKFRATVGSRHPPSDFNGDGKPDYLLLKAATGQTGIWYMNGPTFVAGANGPTLPAGWSVAGSGDFNGDGKPDYLLFNAGTRQSSVWYMNGATLISAVNGPILPTGWSIAASGDFNGDGKPDYVLFNAGTRQTAIWYMNGVTFVSSASGPTLPAGWSVAGIGDFNGDGKPDYLLYSAGTRQTFLWYLNGAATLGGTYGPTAPAGWSVIGSDDFNGDANPDYLLYNTGTRQTYLFYLNGAAILGGSFGPTVPAGWDVVAP